MFLKIVATLTLSGSAQIWKANVDTDHTAYICRDRDGWEIWVADAFGASTHETMGVGYSLNDVLDEVGAANPVAGAPDSGWWNRPLPPHCDNFNPAR
ncbi:MAG: hypothetical protein QUV02_02305 [Maricaulis sp.]|uniref:hypothetical protein n=1 Tax=Maricaulis sp. TaxID=1486257 RepID=UPI00262393D7|nr:hypothetical protein [Maricaulis sp.]MDM7983254.1 hypothetical protein [Maricaulis sp.]